MCLAVSTLKMLCDHESQFPLPIQPCKYVYKGKLSLLDSFIGKHLISFRRQAFWEGVDRDRDPRAIRIKLGLPL